MGMNQTDAQDPMPLPDPHLKPVRFICSKWEILFLP